MSQETGRTVLVDRLHQDLIGPYYETEILESRPSTVYLTGILWPDRAVMDEEDDEKICLADAGRFGEAGSSSSDEEVNSPFAGFSRPRSAGISFAVTSPTRSPVLSAHINFGIYEPIPKGTRTCWQRHPYTLHIPGIVITGNSTRTIDLAGYGGPAGVFLHSHVVLWKEKWLVTLTLVNNAKSDRYPGRKGLEAATLFQVRLEVQPGESTYLVARDHKIDRHNCPACEPSLDADIEDRSTSLLYRNCREYAVGHTCSAEWPDEASNNGTVPWVATTWIPAFRVPAVNPEGDDLFQVLHKVADNLEPLSADWLAVATDERLEEALLKVPETYTKWITGQEKLVATLEGEDKAQAVLNLATCRSVAQRMTEGACRIASEPSMAEAFRLANRAMALQYRWKQRSDKQLIWRPFQLGFILLSATSVVDRNDPRRDTMDLLWFPTGGGKTEAYLALTAFLAFYRRLSAPDKNPDSGAGVAAIMRYTLRLLTTQQFSRATALILACEVIRREYNRSKGAQNLGETPFSIGLWIGGEATPNTLKEAAKVLSASRQDNHGTSPAQLKNCPACGDPLLWSIEKDTVTVRCDNKKCILSSFKDTLPIFTVDEVIYQECPTLLIGTVDKFAQIPRKGAINSLFSIRDSDRWPPDLIIQDELHLISGPLGTIAGLYEVALDKMFTREGKRPKIIGSTATIRRAQEQVRSVFDRETCLFPPQAIDAGNSGFATTIPEDDERYPGRLHIGVTTSGRSTKFTLQAVASSLLQSAIDERLDEKTRNWYWTLILYYNSLRELGGSIVLMQDNVQKNIRLLADLHNTSQKQDRANRREVTKHIAELTSRKSQDEIRTTLEDLEKCVGELRIHDSLVSSPGTLDIVLATNMVSVGVDVPRLGLMVVNGQPKSRAEYIQATSRVGRGEVPGLIVSIYNNAKVRDRSHYESFRTWHATLYRDVEATSVTPFASRARDRALHAVLVSLIRHLVPGMLETPELSSAQKADARELIDYIVARARALDPDESAVLDELSELLEEWYNMRPDMYWDSGTQTKQVGVSGKPLMCDADKVAGRKELLSGKGLITAGRIPGHPWPTMNNMRSIEPSTQFKLARCANSSLSESKRQTLSELGEVRRSSLITTFGPGAVADFAAKGVFTSAIVAGIDSWDIIGQPCGLGHPQSISEPRLEKKLQIKGFRLPPAVSKVWRENSSENQEEHHNLRAIRFPDWLMCPRCGYIAPSQFWERRPKFNMIEWQCPDCLRKHRGGKPPDYPPIPVGFVMACEAGHLDEFPWHSWVQHHAECKNKNGALKLESERPGLDGMILKCPECKAKKSMDGIFDAETWKKRDYHCRGGRPWLCDDSSREEGCEKTPRVLQRGASNIYFPLIISALSIPPWSENIQMALGIYWHILAGKSGEGLRDMIKGLAPLLRPVLEHFKFSDEALAEEIERRVKLLNAGDHADLREEEYLQLTSGATSRRAIDHEFEIRPVVVPENLRQSFSHIVRAVRLREVRALCGFTRVFPPGDENDPRVIPLSREQKDWLPAIEVRGEGIFLAFNSATIERWEQQIEIRRRAAEVHETYLADWAHKYPGREPTRVITPRFLLIHTFAHAVMRQLTMECGYSGASLRERLYVSEGQTGMVGVLIYTATADSDGTLGGLQRQALPERIERTVLKAIQSIEWCSSDPLCILGQMASPDSCSKAACHACILAPETSCEEFNRFLDRGMLVGTPDDPNMGFFSSMLQQGKNK